jgi:hypothetical protein
MEDERDAVQTTMAERCWSNWKIFSAAQHGLQPTPLPAGWTVARARKALKVRSLVES